MAFPMFTMKAKAKAFQDEFGKLTAEEAMTMAEHYCPKSLGISPLDFAYQRFAHSSRLCLEYAAMIESHPELLEA